MILDGEDFTEFLESTQAAKDKMAREQIRECA